MAAALAIRLAAAAIAAVIVTDVKDASVAEATECGVDSSLIPAAPVIEVGDVEFCPVVWEFSYGRNRFIRWCRRHFALLFENQT